MYLKLSSFVCFVIFVFASCLHADVNITLLTQVLERDIPFEVTSDVQYCKAGDQELFLDVFEPQRNGKLRPAVLMLHGGGWNGRDKSHKNFQELSAQYARRGFVVFNTNYRLAKHAPAPAAVQDAHCAARYIHAHAKKYQIDTSRIIATGNSAGCHLALMVALCDSESCKGMGDWKEASHSLRAVVNRFAITDVHARAFGDNPRKSALRWLEKSKRDHEELAREMSPLQYTSQHNLPAILTIHGEADSNTPVSDGIRLHKGLQAFGNSSELFVVPGGNHGLHNLNKEGRAEVEKRTFAFLLSQGVLTHE